MAEKLTANQLARDYLNAAQQRLNTLAWPLGGSMEESLFWAVSDLHHAVEQVLRIVESK